MAPPLITTLGGASTRGFGQGGGAGFKIAAGIIIPFTGASTPTDWEVFSSADGKAIIGAGSTYSNGSTGGSTSFSYSGTWSTAGNHAPNPQYFCASGNGGGPPRGNGAAGNHSHTGSVSGSGHPSYKQYKFIKATADVGAVPAGGIILGTSSLGGDCSVYDSGINRMLYAGSSVATGGGAVSLSGSTSSAGSHNHNTGNCGGNDESYWRATRNSTTGDHTHGVGGSISWNCQRLMMTAWSNAAADFAFEGSGIVMYESATPPEGWVLCDGTGGAPDLRDYFVEISDTVNHGTTAGDNNASVNATTTGGLSHQHTGGNTIRNETTQHYHNTDAWNHTHTMTASIPQLPPYYSLYFLQKAA